MDNVSCIAVFGSHVSGFRASDIHVEGGNVDNFLLHPDPSNATHASFAVQNTGSPTVTVSVAAHTGTTFPSVAASNVFMYSYRPATTVAFVNTAEGSTTTSTQDDLVMTFATPVVGAGPGNPLSRFLVLSASI